MLGQGWDTGLLSVWSDSSPARMGPLPHPSYHPDGLPWQNTFQQLHAPWLVGHSVWLTRALGQAWSVWKGV